MISLTPRLSAAEALLHGGNKTVDVGTDHAYLPIRLIQSGKCGRVLACDIGEQPLLNTKRAVERFGLTDRIELRLSDGLHAVLPEEAEEVSVCGMGGTLIAKILSEAPWLRRPSTHLVLQSMSHIDEVREYLCRSGYRIDRELCVREGGRFYVCISAVWCDEPACTDTGVYYFGTLIGAGGDADCYVKRQYLRLREAEAALSASGRRPEELARLRAAISYYERFFDEGPNRS